MSLPPEAKNALDRLDQIGSVWKTLTDLTIPSKDLDCIDRDQLALSLDFLTKEYRQTQDNLRSLLREGGLL